MELYDDLPALQNGQIRLLRVDANAETAGSTVRCTLTTHSLSNAHEKPDFFALSYTWGSPHQNMQQISKAPSSRICRIICNRKSMEVSENLYSFLQHCALSQDQSLRRFVWVDALCINQRNVPERSHQVNVMGEIYEAASTVIVWLGVQDIMTESAVDLMNGLVALSPEERMKLHPDDVKVEHIDPLLDMHNWKALACFFQRTWFNRAWIIQEVVFARTVTVLCGHHSLSWDQLVKASRFLATTSWTVFLKNIAKFDSTESALEQWHNSPARIDAAKTTWISITKDVEEAALQLPKAIRSTSTLTTDEGLLYALSRARSSSCQDPRDKVYSQLGLGKADIFPDYEHSVAEVYITTAKYILNHSDSLLLLTCIEGEEFQIIYGLPSWVPDWSVTKNLGLRVTGYQQFNAAGAHPRKLALSMHNNKHILSIEATKLDDVVETCDAKQELRNSLHATTFWGLVSRLTTTSVEGQSREEVVWRTLMTNRVRIPPYSRIQYPADSISLGPSFRNWILWRYATASDKPTSFPMLSPADSILPTQDEILDARKRCLEEPEYLTSLANRSSFFDLHYSHALFLRPFRTKQGYFGLGTQCLRDGDSAWIVPGCRVPLIFRRTESSGLYRLVGGSYIHGVMDGEVVRSKDLLFEVVSLE